MARNVGFLHIGGMWRLSLLFVLLAAFLAAGCAPFATRGDHTPLHPRRDRYRRATVSTPDDLLEPKYLADRVACE